ncbi:Extracellular serine protease precursor [compost metagenome]
MAAPYAAGLAALLYSQHPDWTPDQVEAQMRKTADDLGNPGRDDTYGSGRINVLKALAQ